ncbi:MAG: FAD-binding oxidoreductase [Patescibacteria group bacterium]
MKINKSPWIHQLNNDRKITPLNQDIDTDIAIVGAGIAGVSTAFFILKYTNQRVVILDQGKLAHGATGHNAGQVVARFERPLDELVKEFGFEKTKDALQDLHSTWLLLEEMYTDANLDIVFSRINGNVGFSNINQVIIALQDMEIQMRSGLPQNVFLISETAPFKHLLPKVFEKLYKFVPQSEILKKMETEDTGFHALYSDQAGCMNSALFCQEVVKYLLEKFSNRFHLYENTRINKVVLKKDHALLDADRHTVNASKVILCTNGFEHFEILNDGGLTIDKKFHHLVSGSVGYMSGYLEKMNKSPTVIAYLTEGHDQSKPDDLYYYLTRRPHEYGDKKHNLVCMGGPEIVINDRAEYLSDYDYPDEIPSQIDQFVKKEYDTDPNHKIEYEFTWHGLMGYTPNRVRLIGVEPKNEVLLYNLGCNGIGIIPSIYGGRRISRIIAGEKLRPSIFDPRG